MIKGDTPEAACFNSPEEADYRTPPHRWRTIMDPQVVIVISELKPNDRFEVCDACGAMRKVKQ